MKARWYYLSVTLLSSSIISVHDCIIIPANNQNIYSEDPNPNNNGITVFFLFNKENEFRYNTSAIPNPFYGR